MLIVSERRHLCGLATGNDRMNHYQSSLKPAEQHISAALSLGVTAAMMLSLAALSLQGKSLGIGYNSETLTTFSVEDPQSKPVPQPKPKPSSRPAENTLKAARSGPSPPTPNAVKPSPPRLQNRAKRQSLTISNMAFSPLVSGAEGQPENLPISSASGVSIGQSAEVAATGGGGQETGKTDPYAQAVFRKIKRAQRYESALRRRNLAGTVVVAFRVNPRGHLRRPGVSRSSGYAEIDRVALRHLGAAAPFPRPPGGRARAFQIPLTYRQRD